MKLLVNLILILSFNFATAQNYIVSPDEPLFPAYNAPPPKSGQIFFLWSRDSGCYTSDYDVEPNTHVQATNNDVNVFFQAGLGGSTICVSPPPPRYLQRAVINGLDAGNYTMNTYSLPYGDDFPPAIVDYPNYFVDSFQFGVIEGPILVDSTTNIGLCVLILLTLITGLYFSRKNFIY